MIDGNWTIFHTTNQPNCREKCFHLAVVQEALWVSTYLDFGLLEFRHDLNRLFERAYTATEISAGAGSGRFTVERSSKIPAQLHLGCQYPATKLLDAVRVSFVANAHTDYRYG